MNDITLLNNRPVSVNAYIPAKRSFKTSLLVLALTALNTVVFAQPAADTSQNLTIGQCIDYALQHQPGLQRALINESITRTTNQINLSAWLPQVNATGNVTHYLQQANGSNTNGTLPVVTSTGSSARGGYANTFIPQLTVNQAIFSPSLLYTARSAPLYERQSKQVTDSTKINIVSSVSKSFYNLLLTLEQINVLKEDTARLAKNVSDTYHQYVGGIVDETDYEEATITLNNSKAQLKQANENIAPQYASLKHLMGFPQERQFNVNFDTVQMIKNIGIDTTQQLNYEKRIELQLVKTSKGLQQENIRYYQSAFLPTVSAFYNYDLVFANNNVQNIFSGSYPTSLVGLSLSIPIFTGFARVRGLHRARLQEELLNWDEVDLRSQIYTEYRTALANYKSNLYNLNLLQKNVNMAKRVYFVVTLQYKQGIVAYLNVITAESNLITSEINYLNALFQVLSSKIDLQKAMGNITY